MKRNNKKGFTIVELVIVIAVIAILAAVLIPTFAGIVKKANNSAAFQAASTAYKGYTGNVDYSKGDEPAENLIIEVEAGKQYVIVEDGKLNQETVYETKAEAAEALGATEADATEITDVEDDTDCVLYEVEIPEDETTTA